jgi:hypothetical protein
VVEILQIYHDLRTKFFLIILKKNKKDMAKGQDKRKEDKKKPVKTLKEKRAEKRAKKDGK